MKNSRNIYSEFNIILIIIEKEVNFEYFMDYFHINYDKMFIDNFKNDLISIDSYII
jgi:hypothetical protein